MTGRLSLSPSLSLSASLSPSLSLPLSPSLPSSLQVSSSGGWCRPASNPASGEHKTDFALASALESLFHGKSVASMGDGPGIYKKVIKGDI